MKKRFFSGLSLLIALLLIAPSLSLGQPKYGGTLTFGVHNDIKKTDPHKALDEVEWQLATLVCESLTFSSKTGEPRPALAESWDISPDGKTYTFHLRKGVKFHNGREMTAEDVKWNMNRILDPKVGAVHYAKYEAVIDSVEVVDSHTVKFTMKQPNAGFVAAYFGYGGYCTVMAPESANADGSITHPVGTGPFEFVEWKTNDYIKYKKFKDYWQKDLPYLDEIILKPVKDQTVRMTALRTGELDMVMMLSVHEVAKLMKKSHPDYVLNLDAAAERLFVHFNCFKPPFNDVRVRRAVAYGINKKDMLGGIYNDIGETMNQVFTSESPWYRSEVPAFDRDVEKAKALLKEAGYPNGLDVELLTTNTYPEFLMAAQIMQEQLKDIGMRVKLDVNEWNTVVDKDVNMKYSFAIASWSAIPDPELIYPLNFVPGCAYAFLTGKGYDNPTLTELIMQGGREMDLSKRKEIYAKAAAILVEDAPWIWLVGSSNPVGWRSYVKGFAPQVRMILAYADGGLAYTWLDK